eukprot:gene24633-29765_t
MSESNPSTKADQRADLQLIIPQSMLEAQNLFELQVSFVTRRMEVTVDDQFMINLLRRFGVVQGFVMKKYERREAPPCQSGYGFASFANMRIALDTFRKIKGIQVEGILLDCRLSNRSVGVLDDNNKAELDEFVREVTSAQPQQDQQLSTSQHYQHHPQQPTTQYAAQGASSPSAYAAAHMQQPAYAVHPPGIYPVHQYPSGPPGYIALSSSPSHTTYGYPPAQAYSAAPQSVALPRPAPLFIPYTPYPPQTYAVSYAPSPMSSTTYSVPSPSLSSSLSHSSSSAGLVPPYLSSSGSFSVGTQSSGAAYPPPPTPHQAMYTTASSLSLSLDPNDVVFVSTPRGAPTPTHHHGQYMMPPAHLNHYPSQNHQHQPGTYSNPYPPPQQPPY